MNTSKIGVRYAKALFEVASEKKAVDTVRQDIELIRTTFEGSPELPLTLNNPVLKPEQKTEIIQKIFQGKIQPPTLSFLTMILKNRRENYLADVLRRFLQLYRTSKGLKPAIITTATPMNDEVRRNLVELIRSYFKTEVELTEQVNPSLIGGFVLHVDDQQLDASVSSGLSRIKFGLSQKSV